MSSSPPCFFDCSFLSQYSFSLSSAATQADHRVPFLPFFGSLFTVTLVTDKYREDAKEHYLLLLLSLSLLLLFLLLLLLVVVVVVVVEVEVVVVVVVYIGFSPFNC